MFNHAQASSRPSLTEWQKLPQELVDEILTYLEDDFPSLVSCSESCKALFCSTAPLFIAPSAPAPGAQSTDAAPIHSNEPNPTTLGWRNELRSCGTSLDLSFNWVTIWFRRSFDPTSMLPCHAGNNLSRGASARRLRFLPSFWRVL